MYTGLKNSLNTRYFAYTIKSDIEFDEDLRLENGESCTIWIGKKGDVVVEAFDGSIGTFKSVPAGTHLPVQVNKIIGKGTTVPKTYITCLY